MKNNRRIKKRSSPTEELENLSTILQEFKKIIEGHPNLTDEIEQFEKNVKSHKKSLSSIKKIESSVNNKLRKLETVLKKHPNLTDEIEQLENDVENYRENASSVEEIKNYLDGKLQELKNIFEEHPNLTDEIKQFEENAENLTELNAKIQITYKSAHKEYSEIRKLRYEIIGYIGSDDENGEETHVKGLKDELENSYLELQNSLKELKNNFDEFYSDKNDSFNNFINNKEAEYNVALGKVRNLLPEALTAGLSGAYSDKRKAEIEEQVKSNKVFYLGIVSLVTVSLIPVIVSIFSLLNGISLDEVILRIPRLVLSVLPIYIPVLWLTYSANKKSKLSKRLIEEYAHKETLSKTVEGLSAQISNIEEDTVSKELRIKLLYNILEVNSENPGKLISDYNKSDHPLMDALDESVKLANTIDKLNNIPGLSKVVEMLSNKSNKRKNDQEEKVERGLNNVEKEED